MDYDAYKYMINKPQLNGCIARWVLFLQEFNFTVEVTPSKSHANVDHLSRLNKEFGSKIVNDCFLHVELFYIHVIHLEYAEIIEYFQNNKLPIDFNDKQTRRLTFKAMPYTITIDIYIKSGKTMFYVIVLIV
jgi:hypothetical protein